MKYLLAPVCFCLACPIGFGFGVLMVFCSGILTGWTLGVSGVPKLIVEAAYHALMAATIIAIVIAIFTLTRSSESLLKIGSRSGAIGFSLAYLVAWMGFTFGNVR